MLWFVCSISFSSTLNRIRTKIVSHLFPCLTTCLSACRLACLLVWLLVCWMADRFTCSNSESDLDWNYTWGYVLALIWTVSWESQNQEWVISFVEWFYLNLFKWLLKMYNFLSNCVYWFYQWITRRIVCEFDSYYSSHNAMDQKYYIESMRVHDVHECILQWWNNWFEIHSWLFFWN
jgi:hypothetical protein